MYSVCWALAPPNDVFRLPPCILISYTSGPCVVPSLVRAVALTVTAGDSAAALSGTVIALALTQLFVMHAFKNAGLPTMLVITSGAVTMDMNRICSDVAHSGTWGWARSMRLEHPSLVIRSMDVVLQRRHERLSILPGFVSEFERVNVVDAIFAARLRSCARLWMTISSRSSLPVGRCAVTGGLGGLGLRVAASLAVNLDGLGLVLSSRSGAVACCNQGIHDEAQLRSMCARYDSVSNAFVLLPVAF